MRRRLGRFIKNDTSSLPQLAAYKPAKKHRHWVNPPVIGPISYPISSPPPMLTMGAGLDDGIALNVGGGTLINPTTGGVLTRVGPNTAIDPTNGQVHIIANPGM